MVWCDGSAVIANRTRDNREASAGLVWLWGERVSMGKFARARHLKWRRRDHRDYWMFQRVGILTGPCIWWKAPGQLSVERERETPATHPATHTDRPTHTDSRTRQSPTHLYTHTYINPLCYWKCRWYIIVSSSRVRLIKEIRMWKLIRWIEGAYKLSIARVWNWLCDQL